METLMAILGLLLCIGVGLAGVIVYAYSRMTQNNNQRQTERSLANGDGGTGDLSGLFDAETTPEEKSVPASESWWDQLSAWFSGSGDAGGDGGASGGGDGGADGGGGGG